MRHWSSWTAGGGFEAVRALAMGGSPGAMIKLQEVLRPAYWDRFLAGKPSTILPEDIQ